MVKKFEVTEFHSMAISESYFVKLHSIRFTKSELAAIRVLRQAVNKKYPQHKRNVVPTKWRLVVETFGLEMRGQIFIEPPQGEKFNVTAFGTVEQVCQLLAERLAAVK